MTIYRWEHATRDILSDVLPQALVILPIGAVEQHGPHLPTGTDYLAVDGIVRSALDRCSRDDRDYVVTPTMPFGASDHHLPFGGTLSMSVETVTMALLDLASSISQSGGRRLVVVNGHGGNRGACHSAALAASTRYGLRCAYVDYWDVLEIPTESDGTSVVPGHAGAFETSLMTALIPSLVKAPTFRAQPPGITRGAPAVIHSAEAWQQIDGYSDNPNAASKERGRDWLEACTDGLARLLGELAAGL